MIMTYGKDAKEGGGMRGVVPLDIIIQRAQRSMTF